MLAPATYILHTTGHNCSKNLNFSLQLQQATNIGHATGPPWQTCSKMCAFSLWASVSCLESSSLCWRSCRRIASISATRCSNTAMPLFSSGVNRRPRLEVEITYLLCDSENSTITGGMCPTPHSTDLWIASPVQLCAGWVPISPHQLYGEVSAHCTHTGMAGHKVTTCTCKDTLNCIVYSCVPMTTTYVQTDTALTGSALLGAVHSTAPTPRSSSLQLATCGPNAP